LDQSDNDTQSISTAQYINTSAPLFVTIGRIEKVLVVDESDDPA
jgi:hypothetical protein